MTEYMADPTLLLFGKLALAAGLGIIIGTERSVIARQAAGSRTFALVSLASCLFIVAGASVDAQYVGLVNFDPTRVLAAVIQGIGFLGAGLIIFRNDSLHGVTTAAGLWVAAGVGACVGFGMYHVAIFVTLLTILLFIGMWFVENTFKKKFDEMSESSGASKS
jgi:putative Mg2+ transporter-C (MgtC) family protein